MDWGKAELVEQPGNGAETTPPYVNPGSLGHPQHYQGGQADLLALAPAAHELVAVGYLSQNVTADAWHSTDGLRWTRVADFPAPDASLAIAVAAGPHLIAAVGSSGRRAAAWQSSDGASWRAVDGGAAFDAVPEAHMTAVVPWRDGFVAAGYVGSLAGPISAAFWRSPDGGAWERIPATPAFDGARVDGLAIAPATGSLVAVGRAGDAKTATGPAAWTSHDGRTWRRSSLATGTGVMLALASGDSELVAVGANLDSTKAVAWTSHDGVAWDVAPDAPALDNFGLKIEMRAVAWDGTRFVAGGHLLFGTQFSTAVVWTSTNGMTWSRATDVAAFSQGKIQAVSKGGPGLIAAGNFGAPDFSIPTVWISPAR